MFKFAPVCLALLFCVQLSFAQQYSTGTFSVRINGYGRIASLKDGSKGAEYAPANYGSLLQIVIGGKAFQPVKADFDKDHITLLFDGGKTAKIKITANPLYISFRIIDISGDIDAVKWGPINTTIGDTIGNTVGVV